MRKSIRVNGFKYDKDSIRKKCPYVVEYNLATGECYHLNRDYEYIGCDTMVLTSLEPDTTGWKRVYIFRDGNQPYLDKKNLLDYIRRYERIVGENKLNIFKNATIFFTNMLLDAGGCEDLYSTHCDTSRFFR